MYFYQPNNLHLMRIKPISITRISNHILRRNEYIHMEYKPFQIHMYQSAKNKE